MNVRVTALAALAATTILSSAAWAEGFTSLTTFGDSLSDAGNIPGVITAANGAGFGPFPTNFPPSPPYVTNRFSNGPVYAEQLPGLLGIAPGSVTNFALGGAFTGQLTVAPGVVIGNLNAAALPPLSPLDIRTQVTNFLATTPTIGGSDLFIVFGGGNDAFATLGAVAGDPANAVTIIGAGTGTAAGNLRVAASDLIAAGARQIILPNLPDVGETPDAVATGPAGAGAATLFTTLLNTATQQVAADLNGTSGATVYVVDSFAITRDIVANPAKYGFANADLSCIDTPSCLVAPVATQNTFFSFDGTHPTTAGHAILAAAAADTVNAPRTIAAQAETGRILGESFGREMLGLAAAGGSHVSAAIGLQDWDRDGEFSAFGYDIQSTRFTASTSWDFNPNFSGGAAISYEDGDVDIDGVSAGFDVMSLRLGAFVGMTAGTIDFNAAVTHSFDSYDNIKRATGVAGQTADGDTEGNTTTFMAQASRRFEFGSSASGSFGVTPAATIGYAMTKVNSYTETGAVGLNQNVSRRTSKTFYGELGGRLDARFDSGGTIIQPWVGAVYHSVLNDGQQDIRTALASVPGVIRSADIDAPDDDYARIEGGLSVLIPGGVSFGLSAEAIVAGSDISGIGGNARIGWNF